MDDTSGPSARNPAQPSPPRWKGAASLGPVHRLNERCLELMQQAASSSAIPLNGILGEQRDLWSGLEAAARRRLAEVPFVILDARFQDEDWWRRGASLAHGLDVSTASSDLPADINEILVHELILCAWQIAGTHRTVVQLCFGMAPAVASIIAALNSGQVRAITMRTEARVQLRWSHEADLWRELLMAASVDEQRLIELQQQLRVRLCSEVIHRLPELPAE